MSRILPIILILFAVSQSTTALQCLVMRPGYGLVNETCPERTVGCRIKVDVDSIQWYEYSKLYDRSQLVCVLPGEYQQISGCEKKASGSVRCWCGSSECNDPERSRNLYKAFERGGNRAVGEWQATYSYETPGGKKITEESNEIEIVEVQTTTTKRPPVTKKTSTTSSTTTTTKVTTTTEKTTRRPVKPHITPRKKIITKMTTTVPTTTTAIPAVPTTLHRSNYEETRQLLSEEMKEEDDRMQMILDDEEREMLLEADEDEQKALKEAEMARDHAEALKREQERRDEEEMIRLYGYGFRRKGSKQRRREEEKRRVEEEERMEKEARDQAEKAKKRSSESDDSLYDDVPQTDGSPNTVISLTLSTIFFYIIFLF